MRIVERSGERMLSVCSWKRHSACPDRKITQGKAEKVAIMLGIEKITNGICQYCKKILDAELDESENNPLKGE